ncbi:MAG TPA: YihY/virulence factor BrkB family protein [Gaiellaceae bacterium]|nr:YihY/virulence factor BrkB family protein [Gaiellaceae bacterium]
MRSRWRSFKAIVELWVDLFAKHNLLTYASAIAFQTFIAVVAFVLLALGILGAAHDTGLWERTVGPAIRARVLPDVYRGIDQVVHKVFATSSAGLIAFAVCLAVWEVSGVVRAAMGALNRVYEAEEPRPWWRRFPLSFALAAGLIAALLGAIALVSWVDVPGAWHWPLLLGRWLAAIGLIALAFALIVRLAPARPRPGRWVSGGSILVVVAWIVETLIFRWYVTAAADFKTAVGSLSVFIVLSSYLYVAAIILLVAIELDELVRREVEGHVKGRGILALAAGVIRGT